MHETIKVWIFLIYLKEHQTQAYQFSNYTRTMWCTQSGTVFYGDVVLVNMYFRHDGSILNQIHEKYTMDNKGRKEGKLNYPNLSSPPYLIFFPA